jgi:hypothetical protein
MISKMRVLAIIGATAVLVTLGVGSTPVANACDGDACGSFTISGKRITNKDHKNKIHLTGCIHVEANLPVLGNVCTVDGKFDLIVDPDKTKDIEGKVSGKFTIDVVKALLLK